MIVTESGKIIRREDRTDRMVQVYLDWPPTVNNFHTVAKGRKVTSAKGRAWKDEQLIQMRMQKIPHQDHGRVAISIQAAPPDRRRRDLDNLLKPILDVLVEYGAIPDDSHIDELHIRRVSVQKPGVCLVLIRVYEL
jgi:crossover junction endodeoxyribonuclease RusA